MEERGEGVAPSLIDMDSLPEHDGTKEKESDEVKRQGNEERDTPTSSVGTTLVLLDD